MHVENVHCCLSSRIILCCFHILVVVITGISNNKYPMHCQTVYNHKKDQFRVCLQYSQTLQLCSMLVIAVINNKSINVLSSNYICTIH